MGCLGGVCGGEKGFLDSRDGGEVGWGGGCVRFQGLPWGLLIWGWRRRMALRSLGVSRLEVGFGEVT